MRLQLTPRYSRDLIARLMWIAEGNVDAAVRADHEIDVAVRRQVSFPYLGRPGRLPNTREFSLPKWRVVVSYRVLPDAVELIALRHTSQAEDS